jgi:hypothetical protein
MRNVCFSMALVAFLLQLPHDAHARTCTIIGDEIAAQIGPQFRDCNLITQPRASSQSLVNRVRRANVVVISAGNYDSNRSRLGTHLNAIRVRAAGNVHRRVIWILPADPQVRRIVTAVASCYTDRTVEFVAGPDRMHPRSYAALVQRIRAALRQLPAT